MRCNHCFGITRLWDAKVLAHSLAEYADRALARSADADAAAAAADVSPFHGWAAARDAAMAAWARHEAAEAEWEAAAARVRAAWGAVQRAGRCLYGD